MEKLGVLVRSRVSQDLKALLTHSNGCFFVGFNKMSAYAINVMRNRLKLAEATVMVAKNTLVKKVFEEMDITDLDSCLSQETGIVIVKGTDVVKACKALVEFTKENEKLQIRGGFIQKDKISAEMMSDLAKLPARDVLLGMAVNGIASPITGFMATMNQLVVQFLWTVDEIKTKKESGA